MGSRAVTAARPPFPSIIDSTILGTFRSCPQKAFRMYVEHWKPAAESVHLVAGKAFAAGIEGVRRAFYVDKLPPEDALATGLVALIREWGAFEAAESDIKQFDRVCGALVYYFDVAWPLPTDKATPILFGDQHGIEFSFAEPLEVLHPTTGEPLIYCGRADMVAEYCGGIFNADEKTTSRLGPSWSKQWEMRSQFTGYCWALSRVGKKAAGTLVRGLSILKHEYGHAESITYRSPYEIERWYQQMIRDVKRMIACWEEGYWDYNLDHACTEYSGCPLVPVCKSPEPERWLQINFHKRVWNPLTREEELLP